ncbi:MAG: LysM peptidoglycan-binding domain-containing protein [Gammaproteobacteria bacterium]|nr:MAG: LysM peptidoglycan-binding domain-containing protein [Gammaproteobacteria bacterium]
MPGYIRTTIVLLLSLLAGCAQQAVEQAQNNQPVPARKHTVDSQPIISHSFQQKPLKTPVIFTSPDAQRSIEADKDIWQRIRKGMVLQEYFEHPGIAKQVAWYSSNQTYIDRVMGRAEMYLYYIVEQLENNGMPLELALLPVVESAYDPFAYSNSHASGLWQFIPDTGTRFGLRRDWWYDGRRDPVAATEAAIQYLQYLYNYFDQDWLLALAAYNCGEGNVRRAMKRNRKAGKPTDFWSLKLPRETSAYVPQLLAVSRVVSAPEAHQIALPHIDNAPYFDIVDVPDQLDLSKAAELASLNKKQLQQLNAGYSRLVTHPEGPHRILLPTDHTQSFKVALNNTPREQWAPIKQHIVKAGDTLSGIAKKNRVTVNQLRKQNRLQSDLLRIGQRLKIPGSGVDSPLAGYSRNYRVKQGDSLWKIARANNVSVKQLAKWNNLNIREPLRLNQVLSLYTDGSEISAKQKKVRYKVRRGDSFYRIAREFDLSINDILEWNNLNTKHLLKPGQQLTLFVDVLKI